MFSSAEFVEEWNQIFSFKIKESDLAKPTEAFVFNALLNYLKMFNFDIAPMIQLKNSENIAERRSFLVRFCHYVDHIYKISDKSHCFLYYDLKHPAPKKTVHMLNHLLNYLFYWNMFKESIIPLASGKIRQREEIVDKINKYKYENEQIEIKAKMIKKRIEDYRSSIPQTASELQDLIESDASERDNINSLEEKHNKFSSTLDSLRSEEAHLTMQIVSQEEVDSLLESKQSLTVAIAEQENIESNTYAEKQEHSATVAKLQAIMSSIDKAIDLNPPEPLAAHKDCNAKSKELESKLSEIKAQKDKLMKIYEKSAEELKLTEKELASKVQLLKDMEIAEEKEIEKNKVLSETNEALIGDYEHDLHTLEQLLDDEKDVSDYILENTAILVKATMENCLQSKTKDF